MLVCVHMAQYIFFFLPSHLYIQFMLDFCILLQYCFGYKTELFFFLKNPKDLDPSYKMDLDLWDFKEV